MIPSNAFEIDGAREDCIDKVLADSFPASDPPSWTPSIASLSTSGPDSVRLDDTWTDTLKPGDLLPHFTVTDLSGRRVDYSSIWQRKNLVLVVLSESGPSAQSYAEQLRARARDSQDDTVWLVTCDRIARLPSPAAIVADRWGEVMDVAHAPDIARLPTPEELVESLAYVQHRCPECEGEAR